MAFAASRLLARTRAYNAILKNRSDSIIRPSTTLLNSQQFSTNHDPIRDKTVHMTPSRGVNVIHDPLLSKGIVTDLNLLMTRIWMRERRGNDGKICTLTLLKKIKKKVRHSVLMRGNGSPYADWFLHDVKKWINSYCESRVTWIFVRPHYPSSYFWPLCTTVMKLYSINCLLNIWKNWQGSFIHLQVTKNFSLI